MARLEKYSGAQGLPGVRRPQVIADTAVGSAIAALGGQIQRSAGQAGRLAQLAQRRQQQIDDFEQIKAQRQLRASMTVRQAEELQKLHPGAAGYTEAMLAHLEKGREDALKALPETVHASFNQEFEARRAGYVSGFAAQENAANRTYFRQGGLDVSAQLASDVRENPELLEDAFKEGEAVLAAMPLPPDEKEDALRELDAQLTGAWLETRPPKEQVAVLESELRRREMLAAGDDELQIDEDLPGVSSSGAGPVRLRGMPDVFLKRLHENAVKKTIATALSESERIADRIAKAHGHFDPGEIENNSVLEPFQKVQLIKSLNHAISEQKENIDAVNRVLFSEPGEDLGPAQSRFVDRAFAYLDDGETDRNALARGILHAKGVLPKPYVNSLKKGLASNDPQEVGNAYENLTQIFAINPNAVREIEQAEGLEEALTKWRLLTDLNGMNVEEAAEKLVTANDPERRADLEQEFERELSGGKRKQIEATEILDRLGASAYGDVQIPGDEFLNGIDFVEQNRRQNRPGDEIKLAGSVNDFSKSVGVPVIGRLNPDEPSEFYGGLSPTQMGADAYPYVRLMSDLMNPASTASVLLNKRGRTGGGKKASDSGKNDNHGDGGRATEKAQKQVENLNAKLADAKTRREKKLLDRKIRNVKKAAQRAAKGEIHSTRGKGER
ncbi:hypothetical protein [Roseibium marinum]|uniref:Uncharacterized protein n=1 Tax=Roseibium marinum TaxID=281252 RepID=A0A2S3UPJ3_9HYPH|nr:hypothetical protein [Roseibium marinum]POF29594.1 hypothetical protein CLV41_10817 [Roseibium marinum]